MRGIGAEVVFAPTFNCGSIGKAILGANVNPTVAPNVLDLTHRLRRFGTWLNMSQTFTLSLLEFLRNSADSATTIRSWGPPIVALALISNPNWSHWVRHASRYLLAGSRHSRGMPLQQRQYALAPIRQAGASR